MVSSQNSAERTSLRSAAQTTDSTRSGCRANRAATAAERQRAPVIAAQHHQEQDGVGRVEPDAHQMVPPRPEPEQLGVEHVREPGQRVPVPGVVAEGPAESFPGEAAGHLRVVEDVRVVVVPDEFVAERSGRRRRRRPARGPERAAGGGGRAEAGAGAGEAGGRGPAPPVSAARFAGRFLFAIPCGLCWLRAPRCESGTPLPPGQAFRDPGRPPYQRVRNRSTLERKMSARAINQ